MSASPSEQILTEITEKDDTDVMELPPLYDTIDPEHLDTVVQSLEEGRVSFSYAGYEVAVTSKGEILISEPVHAE